ncbi:zinc finger MYM-type protein 1-like [Iris pallida]|uniref:Zinc finger MYM-type protein 1-like n=1 Tax=Iris pallida TaxID=29817 RepID=A0AAX6HL10_IRIPA|nr:zinc finger MYM-type protein 1-like [Iris pallida]
MIKYTVDQNNLFVMLFLQMLHKIIKWLLRVFKKILLIVLHKKYCKIYLKSLKMIFFSLMVDESSDVSVNEQMAVVLHFVDSGGNVKERFIGVVHVMETSSLSLKSPIDNLFAHHDLSLMKVRGQGYDGASNMKGEFNGLKTLIMNKNESAYYVHCFAHQLQLTLVVVARKHVDIANFFNMISTLMIVVGASCKRKDMI